VLYPVVRVPLDDLPGGRGHHDLRVPYDFGGPLALGDDPVALLAAFDEAMAPLRKEWGVVTEFARLHPYWTPPPDAVPRGAHAAVDLHAEGAEHHATHRQDVRRALREGVRVTFHDAPAPSDLDAFLSLYAHTMERLDAVPYFRFDPGVLRRVGEHPAMTLAVARRDADVLAAALFLRAGKRYFYFLSASGPAHLRLRPNNLLLHEAIAWARREGARTLHLGGGSPSLRRFKERLANVRVQTALWRRVHDPGALRALGGHDDGWFPTWFPDLHAQRWSR